MAAAREDCVCVSEERLKLQQENTQLRKEMDDLRKSNLLVQKKAKQQVIVTIRWVARKIVENVFGKNVVFFRIEQMSLLFSLRCHNWSRSIA